MKRIEAGGVQAANRERPIASWDGFCRSGRAVRGLCTARVMEVATRDVTRTHTMFFLYFIPSLDLHDIFMCNCVTP